MTANLMLILTFAPSFLLIAGACTVAAWALRLPDAQSSLVARLTGETDGSGSEGQPVDRI
ncbi:MAG: hypothetical protein K8F92_01455 [Hyphomicrobium sp.]|uniref:hypothetical protein n=1 Tax=Hyphomicrobium sp. TaxID=82 RepID=UPI0025BFD6F6|nr:hypothetical protein [Hyphomicrobium sp.]MBZ0208307.1 hypothetical protein [Hyphomicrobium sp.]